MTGQFDASNTGDGLTAFTASKVDLDKRTDFA